MSEIPPVGRFSSAIDVGIAQQENGVDKAKTVASKELSSKEEVEKAASGFEALLLHEMMQEMWSTAGTSSLLGEENNQSQIYMDMFHQALADDISEGRGIGVKEFLSKELNRHTDASKKR
jgi:Rod binding domain-containing protein